MIGVFDSGLGGLASLSPLRERLPRSDVLYLADTAALPLGEKRDGEIRARVRGALAFFEERGADAVLLACGTASSLITNECKEKFTFPIFDVITPVARAVSALPLEARVALLCTEAAARTGTFAAALARGDAPVYSLACPAFVQMAEGVLPRTPMRIRRVLSSILPAAPDAVVLGCTHFSLLRREIARALPHARIFDAALCGAESTAAFIRRSGTQAEEGRTRFFTTAPPARFDAAASHILKERVRAMEVPLFPRV